MAKYRQGRINDEMLKELADALRGVKDPRVQNAFVCLTGVSVTPDLKYAKVYYSSLRGEPKEVAKGLASSAGYLRREIAHRMNLRITPELTFVFDNSVSHGAHIAELLHKIEASSPAPTESGTEEDDADEPDSEN